MKFRSDIAGLRAVAVLPIVLFHAGVDALPGGFVGVDIFFVISGFLITSLIVKDLATGQFSVWAFYRRRVARIVPALLLVLLATLVAGYLILLPPELADLSDSALFALAFLSNVHFMLTADYFASAAEATPLLHTWSLAVEEQFYIFYPVMLLLIWKWKPRMMGPAVLACTVLSLIAAHAMAAIRPEPAFYLLPARAWELGVGALVALGMFPRLQSDRARQVAAAAGVALIFGAFAFISDGPLFPAPLAIFPVLGTALLIAYGQEAFTSRLLSLPPMQFIGNISYSLYLWHWPVITFYRIQTGFDLSAVETVGLVTVSLALASATYVAVERPCLQRLRNRQSPSDRQVTLGGLGAIAAAMVVAAAVVPLASATKVYPPEVRQIAGFLEYRATDDYEYQFRKGECFIGETDPEPLQRSCLALSDAKPNIVVVGDSHAAQLWRALSERFAGYNVIQATASGCRPVLNAEGAERCTSVVEAVFRELVPSRRIETVILAGRWKPEDVAPLLQTVEFLDGQGVNVVVVGPTPEYEGEFPAILARARMVGSDLYADHMRDQTRARLEAEIGRHLAGTRATFIPLHPLICAGGVCRKQAASGEPYQFDYGHLTLAAAREVVAKFPAPQPVVSALAM